MSEETSSRLDHGTAGEQVVGSKGNIQQRDWEGRIGEVVSKPEVGVC